MSGSLIDQMEVEEERLLVRKVVVKVRHRGKKGDKVQFCIQTTFQLSKDGGRTWSAETQKTGKRSFKDRPAAETFFKDQMEELRQTADKDVEAFLGLFQQKSDGHADRESCHKHIRSHAGGKAAFRAYNPVLGKITCKGDDEHLLFLKLKKELHDDNPEHLEPENYGDDFYHAGTMVLHPVFAEPDRKLSPGDISVVCLSNNEKIYGIFQGVDPSTGETAVLLLTDDMKQREFKTMSYDPAIDIDQLSDTSDSEIIVEVYAGYTCPEIMLSDGTIGWLLGMVGEKFQIKTLDPERLGFEEGPVYLDSIASLGEFEITERTGKYYTLEHIIDAHENKLPYFAKYE